MTFLIVFAVLTAVFALALWGISAFLQAALYNQAASRLPLRAAGAGAGMALFLTGWCWVDSGNPGKYDTLLNFSGVEVEPVDSFEAVRNVREKEQVVKYVKRIRGTGSRPEFVQAKNEKEFARSDADGMVVALMMKGKGDEQPVRFNATLVEKDDGKGGKKLEFPREGLRYVEEKGRRYVAEESPGQIYRPKSGVFVANLILNLVHAVLWVLAFWLGMRFTLGHAIGFGLATWGFFMVVVQPMLLDRTRPKETKVATVAAVDRPAA